MKVSRGRPLAGQEGGLWKPAGQESRAVGQVGSCASRGLGHCLGDQLWLWGGPGHRHSCSVEQPVARGPQGSPHSNPVSTAQP